MDISEKLIKGVYEEIGRRNREINNDAIPHSDYFLKFVISNFATTIDVARQTINLLRDSHKILTMEIVAPDDVRGIDRVEGYVISDSNVVHLLKEYFQEMLATYYEKQFHKHLGVAQVMKEIFPMMKSLNNTEIGQIANKAIMLNEFERLLGKEPDNYTMLFTETKMIELSKSIGFKYTPQIDLGEKHADLQEPVYKTENSAGTSNPPKKQGAAESHRAVDSSQYDDFSKKVATYPLQRVLNIYGLDFFLKVKMRKYEFRYLKKLVDDRQFTRRQDLVTMREYVNKVKANASRDQGLQPYIEDVYALERAIQHAIYFTSSGSR